MFTMIFWQSSLHVGFRWNQMTATHFVLGPHTPLCCRWVAHNKMSTLASSNINTTYPNNNKSYKAYLVKMMTFHDNEAYPPDQTFPTKKLRQISANDDANYFNWKAFGEANPSQMICPMQAQSSTLAFAKKPFCTSSQITSQIGMIWTWQGPHKVCCCQWLNCKGEKFWSEGRGGSLICSTSWHPLEWEEFVMMLFVVKRLYTESSLCLMMLAVQWQLIGHIDDMMKLGKSTLSFNPRHPYTLLCKMCWSKNIWEERELPTQIIFPSMDPLICPLLNLAVFLELQAPSGAHLFGDHYNQSVANILDNIFSSNFFTATCSGNLGTHSIRKGAAAYASQFGLSRDWGNTQGRWRGQHKQVDTYIDINLPYFDAGVASVLCGPWGPCKYATKKGHVILGSFVESIVSNIHAIFGRNVAQVLAFPGAPQWMNSPFHSFQLQWHKRSKENGFQEVDPQVKSNWKNWIGYSETGGSIGCGPPCRSSSWRHQWKFLCISILQWTRCQLHQ